MPRLNLVASCAVLLLSTGGASAHGAGGDRFLGLDIWPLAGLTVGGGLYAVGLARLRRRLGRWPRAHGPLQILAVAGGFALLALALLSPLEAWAGEILSAHMIQHVILIALAPPLFVAGRAEPILAGGLPARMRASLARGWGRRIARTLAPLAAPMPAALLHAGAVWIWHAPAAFDAAAEHAGLHFLEHVCFFGSSLLLFRALARCARDRAAIPGGLAANLFTLIQGGFMGALIALAPVPLYDTYAGTTIRWGLTAIEDQELAGTIMWVPASLAYLIAALVLASRLIGEEEGHARLDTGRP